jgi:uncharacterized RDD family membrane protein YckC
MTGDDIGGDQPGTHAPPNAASTAIAGFWRRLAALLVDGIILGLPMLLFGLALYRWTVSLGESGRLVGFVVALLYFGLLNSAIGGGQTFGKRLLGIRVTDRAGNALSPARSLVRFLVIAIPYFLSGLAFDVDSSSAGLLQRLGDGLVALVVFGGLGTIVYLFIFNRRTRQSLHDLAVGSFVVRGPPTIIPSSLSIARMHWIVVGCWLSLLAIVGMAGVRGPGDAGPLKSLRELQAAIKTQLSVQQVNVRMVGEGIALGTRAPATSFLQVDVYDPRADDVEKLQSAVAGIVLERQPDLLGTQKLIVRVSRGFNLGLAIWSETYAQELDAAGWQARLGPKRTKI